MSTTTPAAHVARDNDDQVVARPVRRSTETKASYKTTEFVAYLAAVVGVLLASSLLGDNESTSDFFAADKAWFFVTLLTIGYMLSRGLAKSGSREHYDA